MISLSKQDIDRMRSKLPLITKAPCQASKSQMSKQRVQTWENTLEAIRKRKELFLIERERKRELRFAELDQQEEEFRLVQRKEALDRAAKLQSDQTEKMKIYRPQKLCAEVLDTVADQQREKLERKVKEQKEKDAYHQLILQQIQAAETIEKRNMERKN
jgi:hypothetical protein